MPGQSPTGASIVMSACDAGTSRRSSVVPAVPIAKGIPRIVSRQGLGD